MNDAFFTNTIWYIALAAASAAVLIVIFIKAPERKKTFAFYFAVLGFTYCIEVSLLLLFGAYTYYPMIRPGDPFFDAVLGNIFSQVSVSSSAVLICVLGLSNRWVAVFSAAYFFIDVFFVQLGIYEHFWYQSVFTLGGFFIYGLIVKYWYKRVFNNALKPVYYPTLLLSAFSLTVDFAVTVIKLLGLRTFQSAIYPDPSKSHIAAGLIYTSTAIIIMIGLHKWNAPRLLKIFLLLLVPICQWGLLKSGVIATKPGWEIAIILFDLAVFYGWTAIMDRCLSNKKPAL